MVPLVTKNQILRRYSFINPKSQTCLALASPMDPSPFCCFGNFQFLKMLKGKWRGAIYLKSYNFATSIGGTLLQKCKSLARVRCSVCVHMLNIFGCYYSHHPQQIIFEGVCGQNVLEATIHDDFITKSGIRCIGFSCSTDFHLRSNEPIKELYSIFGKRSKLLEKSSKLYQSNLQNPQPFPSKLKILNF